MLQRVSLIVPFSAQDVIDCERIDACRRELAAQPRISHVEVIVVGGNLATGGELDARRGWRHLAGGAADSRLDGRVAALREGIEAATGDLFVVFDPRRHYAPGAFASVLTELREASVNLVVAVPRPDQNRQVPRRYGRHLVGLLGQAGLGTLDAFSGLMAVRRGQLDAAPPAHVLPRGSRLALDLLAWPCRSHRDLPVPVTAADRLSVRPFRIDDLRQVKRVLDQRFGTFSRLVQFCMVGASGMVIDLSLYALFQLFLTLEAAAALAIFMALIWNFSLNRRLTFNDSRAGSILRQFATYALGNALGIAVSYSLRLYLPRAFGFFNDHRLAAAVVGIVVATSISFSMSRWVVFIRRADRVASDSLASQGPNSQASFEENALVS